METSALSEFIEVVSASVAAVSVEGDTSGCIIGCNQQFCAMLNVDKKDAVGRTLRELLPRYARRPFDDQIRGCTDRRSPVEIVQALDLGHETRWWRIVAHPITVSSSKIEFVFLTCVDITDKVNLENDLKIANIRFSAVIESAYDGIIAVDSKQRIQLFNAAAEDMFGYSAQEIIGEHLSTLIPHEYRDGHTSHMNQFKNSPIVSRQMFERGGRIKGLAKDGTTFPVEISISKIDVEGATEYTAVVRDISERVRLIDQLRDQATVDSLTGLLNRRAFMDRAEREIALSQRHKQPISVMMIDIDKFKLINDTHGHDGGDMVLKAMAAACASAFRNTDIYARLGGEEFSGLLPVTGMAEAMIVAERLRKVIANAEFKMDWKSYEPIPFTISIGVAQTDSTESIAEVLKRADTALYAAKEAGRNRVIASSGACEVSEAPQLLKVVAN